MTAQGAPSAPKPVRIPAGATLLDADLSEPDDARGLVIFAHGSGSSRHSPRNRRVAAVLQTSGLATVLADLLTPDEEAADVRTGHLRFDVDLLAGRLARITEWALEHPPVGGLSRGGGVPPAPDRGTHAAGPGRTGSRRRPRIGYFGASTGAAAALIAAAGLPDIIGAIVSRGGRPDLAQPALARVRAPTLLIVGARDERVLEWNRDALGALEAEKRLEIVPGATHLFEEPGALDEVARLACGWFLRHFAAGPA